MAELADALDSKSGAFGRVGSTPTLGIFLASLTSEVFLCQRNALFYFWGTHSPNNLATKVVHLLALFSIIEIMLRAFPSVIIRFKISDDNTIGAIALLKSCSVSRLICTDESFCTESFNG